jgi:rfaE bifunctional protein nucleotidyltransferase chain/domain
MNAPATVISKVIPWPDLKAWRARIRESGIKLVVTNGCFDILHAGHVMYLRAARRKGDMLLVGLNSDDSVRALKGVNRPINPAQDRVTVLTEFVSVDAVCVFQDSRATEFLKIAEPDIYVKGGDYTLLTLHPDEREVIERVGAEIAFVQLVPGKSTSAIVQKLGGS